MLAKDSVGLADFAKELAVRRADRTATWRAESQAVAVLPLADDETRCSRTSAGGRSGIYRPELRILGLA
ncbi:hypothetical protein GCM10009565_91340 [Amycolatopsis albidoflavus]